jgi:hypothetical protein
VRLFSIDSAVIGLPIVLEPETVTQEGKLFAASMTVLLAAPVAEQDSGWSFVSDQQTTPRG